MLQRWRQAGDLLRAAYLKRVRFDPVLRWTPEQLAAHQERRWRALARLAAERGPLYPELYPGADPAGAPPPARSPAASTSREPRSATCRRWTRRSSWSGSTRP